MPKARWNVPAGVIDGFDREKQFAPYTGPAVPNGVYKFLVKKMQYLAGSREQNPQLRIGLELVPRNAAERRYKGYFTMAFLNVDPGEKMAFIYVPFLDAIGVTEKEFLDGTITDEQGNISRIGRWRNKGTQLVLGQLKDNSYEKNGKVVTNQQVGWFGAYDPEADQDPDEDPEDEDYDDVDVDEDDVYEDEEIEDVEEGEDDVYEDEEYEDEPEPEPAPRRRAAAKRAPVRKAAPVAAAAPRRKRAPVEDEPF